MKRNLTSEEQRRQLCMDLTERWNDFNMELV